MLSTTQYNTLKTVQIIERDIEYGSVKKVSQLLKRCDTLHYSQYIRLLKMMQDKQAVKPRFFFK